MSQVDLLKALLDGKEVRNKNTGSIYQVKDNQIFYNNRGQAGLVQTDLFSNFQKFEIIKKKVKEYRWVLYSIEFKCYLITSNYFATEEDVISYYPDTHYKIISRIDHSMIEVEVD